MNNKIDFHPFSFVYEKTHLLHETLYPCVPDLFGVIRHDDREGISDVDARVVAREFDQMQGGQVGSVVSHGGQLLRLLFIVTTVVHVPDVGHVPDMGHVPDVGHIPLQVQLFQILGVLVLLGYLWESASAGGPVWYCICVLCAGGMRCMICSVLIFNSFNLDAYLNATHVRRY